jgi:hypothetical protein
MKIDVKIPDCKCLEENSDLNCSRAWTETKITVWAMDYSVGARMNEIQHNYCPQCGKKYKDDKRNR